MERGCGRVRGADGHRAGPHGPATRTLVATGGRARDTRPPKITTL